MLDYTLRTQSSPLPSSESLFFGLGRSEGSRVKGEGERKRVLRKQRLLSQGKGHPPPPPMCLCKPGKESQV